MKNYDCIIGIDPGSNGGIAIWRQGSPIKTVKMPKSLIDIRDLFQYIKGITLAPIVFIEKVQLRSDDISDNPGKAFRIQQLLMSYQQLKDYIAVEDIPYVQVHPMSWQSYLKLRKQKEDKTERKNRYKEAAGYYYPGTKPTLWNADALLIMHFGRLKCRNEPQWVQDNLPRYQKKTEFKF
jgi:hypothetical protein